MNNATSSDGSRSAVPSRRYRGHSHPGQPTHVPEPSPRVSLFTHAGLLAAATAAVFLAGGPAQGSLGIFLACAGIILLLCPARVRVGWPLWAAAGGLVACAALAFLPADWFQPPRWRSIMATAPTIHLPATVTPVPAETGFWLAVLLVSCVCGLLLLAHPIRSRSVLFIAAVGVAACGVYAALAIYARQTGWHYPFTAAAEFGFFPNRNHTATFLLTGSVLSLGVLTVSLRERLWFVVALTAAALTVCVSALFFFSGSRGGVIFLVVGVLVWIAGLGRSHRNVPVTVSVVALVLTAGLLFVISGGEARRRLLGTGGPRANPTPANALVMGRSDAAEPPPAEEADKPTDFRVLIYRDASKLVADSPLTGTGLGAFAPAFAEYREASLSNGSALHPESDWLMLVSEAGVPAFFCALAAGALLVRRLRGQTDHPYWPLRWGCVAAATAAVLHGAVDVPVHRVALGWWILVAGGLGLQAGGRSASPSGVAQRALFALTGVGALCLGALLIRAEWMGGRPLPPFAAAKDQDEILAMFNRHETEAALERARIAVTVSPMAAPLYYQLGNLLLHFEDTDVEADAAFKTQRILNPYSPAVPLQQGDVWIGIDPNRTVSLWLDALEREARANRAQGVDPEANPGSYRALLEQAKAYPAVQRGLFAATARGPAFLLAWLDVVPAELVRAQLPDLSAHSALLDQFSLEQRQDFLRLYGQKGDRVELSHFLETHLEWNNGAPATHPQ